MAAWSRQAEPATTLWFWNTEVGWATVHPLAAEDGWDYVRVITWDKGIAHIAGNVPYRGAFGYVTCILRDGEHIPLCRLCYGGSAHSFGFAIYSAAHDRHQDAISLTGSPPAPRKKPSTPPAQSSSQTQPRTRLLTPAQPQPPTNLRAYPPRVNSMRDIRELAERLRDFAVARDWEQFHTPKNLAMALAGEAGELLAEFQWLTPEEAAGIMADPQAARQVRSEIADVFLYLTRLADVLGVDLLGSAADKLEENERRYDTATYRGSRRKAPALPEMNPTA